MKNGIKDYVFDALDGVVVGHLDGRGFGLLLSLVLDDLTQFVPPEVAQRRTTAIQSDN